MLHHIRFKEHSIQVYDEGQGEPIVFLHGWPTNAKLWQAQANALKAYFRVIRPEWLGFGGSDKPEEHRFSFTENKEALDTVLQALLAPGEKVNLVGHDIGGPPGLLWAAEHEDQVKRLILLNTVLFPFKTRLDAFSEWLMHTPLTRSIFVSRMGLSAVLQTNTRSWGKAVNQRIKAILAANEESSESVRLHTLLDPVGEGRSKETPGLSQKFSALSVPKYLIIAKKDPLLYAHIRQLSKENPAVPSHIIPNCGHFIPIDRPNHLNRILLDILRSDV
ncbi:MAG: alpha/beta hydrolase [Bacteroidota bacterium]